MRMDRSVELSRVSVCGVRQAYSLVSSRLFVLDVLIKRLANSTEAIAKLVLLEKREVGLAKLLERQSETFKAGGCYSPRRRLTTVYALSAASFSASGMVSMRLS